MQNLILEIYAFKAFDQYIDYSSNCEKILLY